MKLSIKSVERRNVGAHILWFLEQVCEEFSPARSLLLCLFNQLCIQSLTVNCIYEGIIAVPERNSELWVYFVLIKNDLVRLILPFDFDCDHAEWLFNLELPLVVLVSWRVALELRLGNQLVALEPKHGRHDHDENQTDAATAARLKLSSTFEGQLHRLAIQVHSFYTLADSRQDVSHRTIACIKYKHKISM